MTLSIEEIQAQAAALLAKLDTNYKPARQEPGYGPYHRAAAVLSSFDPQTLRPAPGPAGVQADSIEALLESCTPAGGAGRYALLPNIRREVLEQLGTREVMLAALEANAGQHDSAAPAMLEAYIRGDAPALAGQDARQIAATFQAVQWLEGLIDGLPAQADVRQRWDYLDLLRPCEMLAGEKFRGREVELGWLQSYVFEQDSEQAARLALVIHGPGGVGKSALVARFIQQIVERPAGKHIPWAYIDFDQAGIEPEEPLTILIEAVRQLGIQYPTGRESADRFRRFLQKELAEHVRTAREAQHAQTKQAPLRKGTQQPEWSSYVSNFASLLALLSVSAGAPGDAPAPPFLLVLDTFEEVQYRSTGTVRQLFDFLEALRQVAAQLRPVLVGRNPVRPQAIEFDGVPLPLRPAAAAGQMTFQFATKHPEDPARPQMLEIENRELGDFKPDAAQALLEAEGIPPDLARRIVTQVGGSPLSLRLVTDLWRRDLIGEQGLSDMDIDLEFQIQEGQIQGVLFARILDHIHDPEVRRLAHPGLVLRRVTPELIATVLAKSCDIQVPSIAHAKELFDRLAEEEALVTLEGDVLRHRSDVRRVMVRLLYEKEPRQVREIEQAAVRYYSKRESAEERAEEIYHRLRLGQSLSTISKRWADAEQRGWVSEMRQLLFNAREELAPRERAWLAARLDFELTTEEAEAADQASWERHAQKSAQQLLDAGQPEQALLELEQRPQWLPGSPLYLLAAQALEQLENWQQARDLITRGIRSAAQRGDRALALDMHLRGARIDLKLGDLAAADRRLDQAERLLRNSRWLMSLIEIDLYRLALAQAAQDQADIAATSRRLLERFGQVSDNRAAQEPALVAWLAAELGPQHQQIMARSLRLIGLAIQLGGGGQSNALAKQSNLEVYGADPVQRLIVALAAWDDAISAAQGQPPGVLARSIGVEPQPNATPSRIWRTYLYAAKPEESGRKLAHLLERPDVPATVLEALAALMRQRAGERAVAPAVSNGASSGEAEPPPAVLSDDPESTTDPTHTAPSQPAARITLTGPQAKTLSNALIDAFPSREALEEFLQVRFDRRLETLTLGGNLQQIVYELIKTAQDRGRILQLVDAALSVRPDNLGLSDLAAQLGIGAVELDQPRIKGSPSSPLDAEFLARTARIATQVCRVEVGTAPLAAGTGFLLGPDVVMTAYAAVEPVIRGEVPPTAVSLRFDYRATPDGQVVNTGVVFTLERDWLIDACPYSGPDHPDALGYALLRVAAQPGYSGIGNSRGLESFAELRGWIAVPSSPPELKPGGQLFVLYQREDAPLHLSVQNITAVDPGQTIVEYQATTAAGSAGAPCFDSELNLAALHLGSSQQAGVGATFAAVLKLLERRGHLRWLGGRAL